MLPGRVVRGRPNPLHHKFPERLKRARRAAGLTSMALSMAAGMGRGREALLESADRVPRLNTVERLAAALKVSPAFLAYGSAAPFDASEDGEQLSAGIAKRARAARELRGLSLREAGRRMKSYASAVQAIERGTMPSIDTAEALAGALRVSPAWLAYGIGPMELSRRGARADAAIESPAVGSQSQFNME